MPTNITPASRIDARRPIRSPSQPQSSEPSTIPVSAHRGSQATGTSPSGLSGDRSPYSRVMPGITNPSVVGFITSIVTAAAMTRSNMTWVRRIGASSSARTRTRVSRSGSGPPRGTRPYAVSARPARMSAIPAFIGPSIGIPAIW